MRGRFKMSGTITDNFLQEIAKLLNSESASLPTHLGFGAGTVVISPTMTALSDEIGTRVSTSNSRVLEVVTFNGVRTGASLVSTDGDTLKSVGLFTASTDGLLESAVSLPDLLQTTDYDLDVDFEFTVSRR